MEERHLVLVGLVSTVEEEEVVVGLEEINRQSMTEKKTFQFAVFINFCDSGEIRFFKSLVEVDDGTDSLQQLVVSFLSGSIDC